MKAKIRLNSEIKRQVSTVKFVSFIFISICYTSEIINYSNFFFSIFKTLCVEFQRIF